MQYDDGFFGILVRWRTDFQCIDIVLQLTLVVFAVSRYVAMGFLFFVLRTMARRRGKISGVGGVSGSVARVGSGDEYVSKGGHQA